METHNLIDGLTQDLRPVARLASPGVRFFRWVLLPVICVAGVVSFYGLRSDWRVAISSLPFVVETGASLFLGLFAALTTFYLSVPGEEKWRRTMPITVGLLVVWIVALIWRFASSGVSLVGAIEALGHGHLCAKVLLLVSVGPAAGILLMLRNAAPFRIALCGGMSLLAVGALSSVGLQSVCRGEDPFHVLFWHVSPVVVVVLSGILLGKLVLRRV